MEWKLHKIQQDSQHDVCLFRMSCRYHSMRFNSLITMSSLSSCLLSLSSWSEIFSVRSCVDSLYQTKQNNGLQNFLQWRTKHPVFWKLAYLFSMVWSLAHSVRCLMGCPLANGREISYYEPTPILITLPYVVQYMQHSVLKSVSGKIGSLQNWTPSMSKYAPR